MENQIIRVNQLRIGDKFINPKKANPHPKKDALFVIDITQPYHDIITILCSETGSKGVADCRTKLEIHQNLLINLLTTSEAL